MTDLQNEFNDLLNNELLKSNGKDIQPNILEIGKVAHRELPLSNMYAYFFNPTESHGLGNIFIESLVKLINDNFANDFIIDFTQKIYVHTEVHTSNTSAGELCKTSKKESEQENSKSIDILISDLTNSIIIENKIHASHEYNPFETYYSYVHRVYKKTAGVILSINKLKSPCCKFYSITHRELYQEVEKKMEFLKLNERQSTNIKYLLEILKSFYSEMNHDPEILDFYKNNQENFAKLSQLLTKERKYILGEIKRMAKTVFEIENEIFEVKDYEESPQGTNFFKDETIQFNYKNAYTYSSLKGFIYLDAYKINPIHVGIWIISNKKLVEEWFHKSSKFNDIMKTNTGIQTIYHEVEKTKSFALTFQKDYIIDSQNFDATVNELKDSLKNEWIPLFKEFNEKLSSII